MLRGAKGLAVALKSWRKGKREKEEQSFEAALEALDVPDAATEVPGSTSPKRANRLDFDELIDLLKTEATDRAATTRVTPLPPLVPKAVTAARPAQPKPVPPRKADAAKVYVPPEQRKAEEAREQQELARLFADAREALAGTGMARTDEPPAELLQRLAAEIEAHKARIAELEAELEKVSDERDTAQLMLPDPMAHLESQKSAAERYGLEPGELQAAWRRLERSDTSELEWAVVDALGQGGIAAWPGGGVEDVAGLIIAQIARAELAEAGFGDAALAEPSESRKIPSGWQLVPDADHVTVEMARAWMDCEDPSFRARFRALLAAAPSPDEERG